MKKIILIGASGFVGNALLMEALRREIQVIAIGRDASKIKVVNPNLKVIEADISKKGILQDLAQGVDTIISAYNPGWTNPNIYKETLEVYPQIVKETKVARVKRLLMVGGAGTLFVAPGVRVMDTNAIPEAIIDGVKSLGEFYLNFLLKEKEIDWVFFSPAGTFDVEGESTGNYTLGKDDLIVNAQGESVISLKDYAKAMLDEYEEPSHHQERFTIGYK